MVLDLLAGSATTRTVFDDIQDSGPPSVFDTLRETAPKSIFEQIHESAPCSAEVLGESNGKNR